MPEQKGMFYEEGTDKLLNQCAGIKCIQIGKDLLDNSKIDVSEGKTFENIDFVHKKNEAIPVLMGNAYSSLYHIGDMFEAKYLFDNYNFKIIGFLTEESSMQTAFYNIELDNNIVMPSFEIDASVPITDGLKIHYANKTSGIVRLSDTNTNVFNDTIVPLLENANLGNYSWTISPIENQFKDQFNISINQTKIIVVIGILVLMLGEICFVYHFSRSKQNNLRFMSRQNIAYGIFIFFIASFVCIMVNLGFINILDIKLIRSKHFVYIALLSVIIMVLTNLFYKDKK